MKEKPTKCFVLDTNVLVDEPDALFKFEENDVAIVDVTLRELDGLKKAPGDSGYNARRAIKNIAAVFEKGLLETGETTNPLFPGGGKFKILKGKEGLSPDDAIIDAVDREQGKYWKPEGNNIRKIILVTNDIAMRIKAIMKKVAVQEYLNSKVKETSYMGYREICVPDEDWGRLHAFYQDSAFTPDYDYVLSLIEEPLEENEYLQLSCGNMIAVFRTSKGKKKLSVVNKNTFPCHITPKNIRQRMALDALMAPADEIPLVILKGPAGCAKTFLALAAGLDGQFGGTYGKVIITRNNILADKELGYLKGSLEEKMDPLLAPFYDNLEIILRGKSGESIEQIKLQIEDLKASGALEIASMAYMRGRSIANSFIIIDEVQNTTPKQVLNIVTRAGIGSKVVLCGDPDQIDAPYLSRDNNGLVFAAERMKGSELCAQITFGTEESIRSPLAYDAAVRFAESRK